MVRQHRSELGGPIRRNLTPRYPTWATDHWKDTYKYLSEEYATSPRGTQIQHAVSLSKSMSESRNDWVEGEHKQSKQASNRKPQCPSSSRLRRCLGSIDMGSFATFSSSVETSARNLAEEPDNAEKVPYRSTSSTVSTQPELEARRGLRHRNIPSRIGGRHRVDEGIVKGCLGRERALRFLRAPVFRSRRRIENIDRDCHRPSPPRSPSPDRPCRSDLERARLHRAPHRFPRIASRP